jgi:hypothetical protein
MKYLYGYPEGTSDRVATLLRVVGLRHVLLMMAAFLDPEAKVEAESDAYSGKGKYPYEIYLVLEGVRPMSNREVLMYGDLFIETVRDECLGASSQTIGLVLKFLDDSSAILDAEGLHRQEPAKA